VDAGCAVPPNMRSVAGVEIARITDRSRYLRCCALGGRPFDCADGASASGGEAYFSLAMEWRLRRALRSSPNRPSYAASRPIEASKAVACYVCNTSIALKNSA
jgi:hypothetical protein